MKSTTLYEGIAGMRHLLSILTEAQESSTPELVMKKLHKIIDELRSIVTFLSENDNTDNHYFKKVDVFIDDLYKDVVHFSTFIKSSSKTKPVIDTKFKSHADFLLYKIRNVRKNARTSLMAIEDVRVAVPELTSSEFDNALIELVYKRKVYVHEHSRPFPRPEEVLVGPDGRNYGGVVLSDDTGG